VSAEGPVDVEVTAGDDVPLRDVLLALGRVVGAVPELWAGSTRLPPELPLDAAELRHGAVLGLGRPGPRDPFVDSPTALQLQISGGPCAGTTSPLGLGRHVVGRGTDATIRLDDPDVSRRHVEIDVRTGAVTVADLGSTNGTWIDEDRVGAQPQTWAPGAALRLGASTLRIAGPSGCPIPTTAAPGGRLTLRPPERFAMVSGAGEVALPRAPEPVPPRRLAWIAVALPAIGGLTMAWLLRTPAFLFFALLSPLIGLGTWACDRLTGRRSGRRAATRYATDLAEAEARLAAAVGADVRALAAGHPDLATVTAAAHRRSQPLWERQRSDPDALVVRLGTGPGRTRDTRVAPDGSRSAAVAADLPVLLDLRGGGLGVVGPPERARQVLAGVLAQLTALQAPGECSLLLLTAAEHLRNWAWARWLPHLGPRAVLVRPSSPAAADDEALHRALTSELDRRRPAGVRTGEPLDGGSLPAWLVVVVDGPVDAGAARALREHRDAGVVVLSHGRSLDDLPAAVPAVLRLGGETGDRGVLSRSGSDDRPDVSVVRMPPAVAAAFARHLAALAPSSSGARLPREVRLLDLPSPGGAAVDHGRLTGGWARTRNSLLATLGRTAEGPFTLDLCRAGPHALIAGTTGSGKSELLQALVTSLAMNHPPDRCAFLLVDYKGGAAFAEAADLPHTVGLVTDLDAQSTSRALRSLGAELTRREEVLAAHGAAELADLPDDVPLARLVIVVDEFATLAEELPAFVPELVGIAQRGRSLGVHLVLATQRPGGVVSPEIRANCSLRICLRTADDGDSRDVIGTPAAAHLPLDVPGRGYVRLGSGAPLLVQVARVSGTPPTGSTEPVVRRWHWPAEPTPEPSSAPGSTDLAAACRAITERARTEGVRPPYRPWLPPLPARLAADELRPPGHQPSAVLRLGLLDRPDHQRQEPLELALDRGGSWLALGGPRSGRSTLLRTVLTEAVRSLPPERLHVHVIDVRGGALAEEAAALPHAGTVIGRGDALRTVRLVARLAQEVAERRAAGPRSERPALLLLVDGSEDVLELLDDADPGAGSATLLRLVRDGAAAGLTAVLTADRAVPGGRLAAVAEQRLVLPLPDRADYVIAGVAAAAVPAFRPAGRALLGEEAVECQLALPAGRRPEFAARAASGGALCIPELPPDPAVALPGPGPEGTIAVPLGPGGDEGTVLDIDLARTGGLLVAGPPGSGRSTLLDALARHLTALGTPVLRLAPRIATDAAWFWARPDDQAGVQRWLGTLAHRMGVVLADDVGVPADTPALAVLPPASADGGVALVAASTAGELSAHYQGPVAALRRSRTGLLLSPQPGDADLLGVRLPRTPVPSRPGSGWLVRGGSDQRVQVARRRIARSGEATG
jgi:S-DNA-T family DNA segregation ATPase FtsK/SpoIIIE